MDGLFYMTFEKSGSWILGLSLLPPSHPRMQLKPAAKEAGRLPLDSAQLLSASSALAFQLWADVT